MALFVPQFSVNPWLSNEVKLASASSVVPVPCIAILCVDSLSFALVVVSPFVSCNQIEPCAVPFPAPNDNLVLLPAVLVALPTLLLEKRINPDGFIFIPVLEID